MLQRSFYLRWGNKQCFQADKNSYPLVLIRAKQKIGSLAVDWRYDEAVSTFHR